METRAAKKRRLIEEENKRNGRRRDRFSDLPDEISHHILSFLPMKSIAQVSATSKRWRSLWASFPILDFSEVCPLTFPFFQNKSVGQIYDQQLKVVRFISSVLSRRHENSNIRFFALVGYVIYAWLHDWMPWLVKYRVEKLVLKVWSRRMCDFTIPQCLFECDSLKSLTLESINFPGHPPPPKPQTTSEEQSRFSSYYYVRDTGGLRSLRTLSLNKVNFSNVDGDFFSDSSFPLLEELTINSCRRTNPLKICCANLKDLQVCKILVNLDISGMKLESLIVKLCFRLSENSENLVNIVAPNLLTFHWEHNDIAEKSLIQNFPNLRKGIIHQRLLVQFHKVKTHAAVNFLSALSQVQNLSVSFHILEILSKIYFEGGLPYSFMNLKTLEVVTSLNKSDVPGIACLFKSSPVVQTLNMAITSIHRLANDRWNNILLDRAGCSEEQFWESQAQTLSPFLCHLKLANLRVADPMHVVDVARFLLKHGRELQEMVISVNKAYTLPAWDFCNKISIIEGLPRSSDVKLSCLIN
ncbi:hypothetical protein ACE6H2_011838 [Prunus campanulata]